VRPLDVGQHKALLRLLAEGLTGRHIGLHLGRERPVDGGLVAGAGLVQLDRALRGGSDLARRGRDAGSAEQGGGGDGPDEGSLADTVHDGGGDFGVLRHGNLPSV